ncbi:MAG TPA: beta-N-acetylhexosaminidase, partial [Anseongella sp.]|nr:beta-N-acetylhexosaminidase [Anseongella sp.]
MINKYLSIFLLLLAGFPGTFAQASLRQPAIPFSGSPDPLAEPPAKKINLIPVPVNLEMGEGIFALTSGTSIVIDPNKEELRELAPFFAEMIAQPTGFNLPVTGPAREEGSKSIHLILNKVNDQLTGREGYRMKVSPAAVSISANEPAGLFYGMQTLMQLFPEQMAGRRLVKDQSWEIPCLEITDFPRFQWRGLMLDVSRHFFPVPFVKKYIDQLAKYKMNVFHWHLTDDQGWRIEIKTLPRLTSVGAWRVPRTGLWWERDRPAAGEIPSYGGFYTQEEISEVVRYAQTRYVTILPEIDVPGHSLAAIAAYPEYACVEDTYHVNPGSKFYMEVDNTLCTGNEKTYQFLDQVFTEVAQLFPGRYIHVGGDEAYKGFWKKCPKCQRKMQQEGLKNVDQLQSYF